MSTGLITRQWPFDAGLQAWTSSFALAFDGSSGDPLPGCGRVGPGLDANFGAPATGNSWTDWGLANDAVITSVDMVVHWRVLAFSVGASHDVLADFDLSSAFQDYTIIQQVYAGVTADGLWRTSTIVGSTGFNLNSTAGRIQVSLHLTANDGSGALLTVEYDTITVTVHWARPGGLNPVRIALPPIHFIPLFEGDDMTCRKALERAYSQYAVQSGEKIWGFQLIRNYCADWIEVSVGAFLDNTQAAGSKVLNGNFGVRVYECAVGGDAQWAVSTANLPIGRGTPFPFPAWQSPVLIPWMGRNVNVLVELYTDDSIAAGTTLELGIAPIQEGV